MTTDQLAQTKEGPANKILKCYGSLKVAETSDGGVATRSNIKLVETLSGTVTEATGYIKNHGRFPLQPLEPFTEDVDLHITKFPAKLMPGEVGTVEMEFTPSVERVEPLQAGWGFRKVRVLPWRPQDF